MRENVAGLEGDKKRLLATNEELRFRLDLIGRALQVPAQPTAAVQAVRPTWPRPRQPLALLCLAPPHQIYLHTLTRVLTVCVEFVVSGCFNLICGLDWTGLD